MWRKRCVPSLILDGGDGSGGDLGSNGGCGSSGGDLGSNGGGGSDGCYAGVDSGGDLRSNGGNDGGRYDGDGEDDVDNGNDKRWQWYRAKREETTPKWPLGGSRGARDRRSLRSFTFLCR